MKRNKRVISILLLLCLVAASLAGCGSTPAQPDDTQEPQTQEPADTPNPAEGEDAATVGDAAADLPQEITLTVNIDGQEQEQTAQRTESASGLILYLLPGFMLTGDGGYDILLPEVGSGYQTASLTILNQQTAMTAEEALASAQENYPGVEFSEATPMVDLGHMQEGLVITGALNDNWVVCLGMSGENGSVSVWGQGPAPDDEGLRALLINQVATVVKP